MPATTKHKRISRHAILRNRMSSCAAAFCAIVAAFLTSLGFAAHQNTASASGSFNKVWTVARSQFNQSADAGLAVTQLTNGTLVIGGQDANQPNFCSTHRQPLFGGAWLVAVTPSGGNKVWQKLYSTCASGQQDTSAVAHTPDGGFILAGGDFDNPACGGGCGWFAKFDSNGSLLWQHDLIGDYAAGADQIVPTPDGGYIAVGNRSPTNAEILQGLIIKISPNGNLQWSASFPETDLSFPGAFTGGGFTFESLQLMPDGGYIVSGVAEARFPSGFAHVMTLMKLDANANVQWSNAYYGNVWASAPAGEGKYPIFRTPDGGYIFSGTVQQPVSPFEELFFLTKLDSNGKILWQKGYGGSFNNYDISAAIGGAVATADGGYVMAGESNIFLQATTGWLLKTDALGNILWQKSYTGLTAQDGNQFNDVIQTGDGGYAVTGESWTANLTYGGPGMWLVKTDSNGNVGTCSCMQETNVTPQPLDLQVHQATFTRTTPNLRFGPVNIQAKTTSITPTTVYP